jgi:hypothetical protein
LALSSPLDKVSDIRRNPARLVARERIAFGGGEGSP